MGMVGVEAGTAGAHQAMRSAINWALLGLVLQRASYGYELVQRFERVYGEAIELSSPSQIYTALDALVDRGLTETVPPEELEEAGGRQPKPHYRATAAGARAYEQWLVCQSQQERRRSRMFARQLAALAPQAALSVLERCEQLLLEQASAPSPRAQDGGEEAPEGPNGLGARLVAEEDRLGFGARLEWIEYARRELKAQPQRRPAR
jgi:DNA-binding PadR family transcriptional regulator